MGESSISDNEILEKIIELEERISSDLKELEQLTRSKQIRETKIKFPGGIIKHSRAYRETLPFILNDTLRRNVSYHLMLDDIFIWFLEKFDFYLVAEALLIKIAIANFGTIIEALVKSVADNYNETKKEKEIGVKRSCSILIKHKIIHKALKKRILLIWDIRNKQHLTSLRNWEYERYEMEDYYEAIDVYNELISEMNTAFENGKIPTVRFYK